VSGGGHVIGATVAALARAVLPGDVVRLDCQWQKVLDVGPGQLPDHTLVTTQLATYQFPNAHVLSLQYAHAPA
jgi:hypothetical protein